MDGKTTPYLIERQTESEAPWRPVARCRSLIYARKIALAGLRRRVGVSYRALNLRTGNVTPLNRLRSRVKVDREEVPREPQGEVQSKRVWEGSH